MSSDAVHTVAISLRDTITRSVTFAPERATVAREVVDLPIKWGPNEIIIHGFDPDVDPDSLRVTGRGPATITDIQTQVNLQKDQFEDHFPKEESSEDDCGPHEEDLDDKELGLDRSDLDKAEKELAELDRKLAARQDERATSTKSLEFLDNYGKSICAKDVEASKMVDYINVYQKERTSLNAFYQESSLSIAELEKEREKISRKRDQLEIAYDLTRFKVLRPIRQARLKAQKARDLRKSQKRAAEQEKRKFWPNNVGQVTLYLDGFGDGSPNDSRRNSVSSQKSVEKPTTTGGGNSNTITLFLSYVTTKATWTPRYELSLKTPTSSGRIIYRAEYHNYSSETWKDTNIILSTSQTSFAGINETIPILFPWNVKLHKQDENSVGNQAVGHWKGGLNNTYEAQARKRHVGRVPHNSHAQWVSPEKLTDYQMQLQILENHNRNLLKKSEGDKSFSNAPRPALFGAPNAQAVSGPPPPLPSSVQIQQMQQQQQQQQQQQMPYSFQQESQPYSLDTGSQLPGSDDDTDDEETATIADAPNVLAFQESSRHDYGLTTTYDIPGQRTVRPSSHKRRHVIAELELSSINFSHVIIPKLRAAAFLKARITNTSSTTLLRGKAGLTVDEAFLGTSRIPNCAPKTSFSLNLGVDPGILVTYAKPGVRRATTGFFAKEDCAIFTRSCRINNTKSSSVSMMILDQIPVSEDDRLRIRVIEPKGLDKDEAVANLGAEICNSNNKSKNWGKGTVHVGKNGEIKWQILLEKEMDIKLTLQYEVKIPSGQKMVGLE